MGKSATNIAIVLGLITVAFGGYYMYTQTASSVNPNQANDAVLQNMLANTRVFIERSNKLDGLLIDLSFFEEERFSRLQNFTQEIEEQPIGRPNPFAVPVASTGE